MKRTRYGLAALFAFSLASCVAPSASRENEEEQDHEHGGGAAVTVWTENVELFFEYPPMVAGEAGQPWAIHLTFLEDFQPVREGKLAGFIGASTPGRKRTTLLSRSRARRRGT